MGEASEAVGVAFVAAAGRSVHNAGSETGLFGGATERVRARQDVAVQTLDKPLVSGHADLSGCRIGWWSRTNRSVPRALKLKSGTKSKNNRELIRHRDNGDDRNAVSGRPDQTIKSLGGQTCRSTRRNLYYWHCSGRRVGARDRPSRDPQVELDQDRLAGCADRGEFRAGHRLQSRRDVCRSRDQRGRWCEGAQDRTHDPDTQGDPAKPSTPPRK